jgi:hypothetical protein
MPKTSKPRKKSPLYSGGDIVLYYGNSYIIAYCFTGDQGHWYRLVGRLGLIHETELKGAFSC